MDKVCGGIINVIFYGCRSTARGGRNVIVRPGKGGVRGVKTRDIGCCVPCLLRLFCAAGRFRETCMGEFDMRDGRCRLVVELPTG